MSKKYRSKWFQIATEGATTDGRNIERQWLEDMAEQYSPKTYGARLNCEHFRSMWPGGEFGAYGDVLALKTEEVTINGEKKLALFAQIEPTESLIELNKKGQKIYTSIEVNPKFADTNKAYLVGLAITDSPASLGTEALSFSAKHGTLANRKQDKDNLFTAAEETVMEFEEVTDTPGFFSKLTAQLNELRGKGKEKDSQYSAAFNEMGELIQGLIEHGTEQAKAFAAAQEAHTALKSAHEQLAKAFAELKGQLASTTHHNSTQRPAVTGGGDTLKTTF